MTRDEVLSLAREAGTEVQATSLLVPFLERFAALVAAREREACAKLCDEKERANLYGVKECAAAIRARSKE